VGESAQRPRRLVRRDSGTLPPSDDQEAGFLGAALSPESDRRPRYNEGDKRCS